MPVTLKVKVSVLVGSLKVETAEERTSHEGTEGSYGTLNERGGGRVRRGAERRQEELREVARGLRGAGSPGDSRTALWGV